MKTQRDIIAILITKYLMKRNLNNGFSKERIKNKILFYQWNKKVDLTTEKPETPQNFEKKFE